MNKKVEKYDFWLFLDVGLRGGGVLNQDPLLFKKIDKLNLFYF